MYQVPRRRKFSCETPSGREPPYQRGRGIQETGARGDSTREGSFPFGCLPEGGVPVLRDRVTRDSQSDTSLLRHVSTPSVSRSPVQKSPFSTSGETL